MKVREKMFCSNCGNELKESTKFCERCGTPVSMLGEQSVKNEQIEPLVMPKKKKGKKAGLIVSLAVVLSGCIAGTGIYFTSNHYKLKKNEKLAESCMRVEDYSGAINYYEEMLRLDSSLSEVYLYIAEAYMESGSMASAEDVIRDGISATNDDDGSLYALLARIYRSKSDEALDEGDYAQALQLLADGEAETGDKALKKRIDYVKEHILSLPQKEICGPEYRIYEYDASGNKIRMASYSDGTCVGCEKYEAYIYEYDEAGNLIREGHYDEQRREDAYVIYDYDEAGNPIRATEYQSSGEVISFYVYEYDKDGNPVRVTKYYPSGETAQSYDYTYDEAGNLIRATEYRSSGEMSYFYIYEYDTMGNKIKDTLYDADGEEIRVCEYGYDENGNQIRKAEYRKSRSSVYEYDTAGRVLTYQYVSPDAEEACQCEYDESGRLVNSKASAKGEDYNYDFEFYTKYEYDTEGRPSGVYYNVIDNYFGRREEGWWSYEYDEEQHEVTRYKSNGDRSTYGYYQEIEGEKLYSYDHVSYTPYIVDNVPQINGTDYWACSVYSEDFLGNPIYSVVNLGQEGVVEYLYLYVGE